MKDRETGPLTELPARRLSDLDVDAYLGDPQRKQQFVTPMFDTIAPQYDRFTRLFSLGMDRGWKQGAIDAAVEQARASGSVKRVLDLASGTGDLAIAVAHRIADAEVQCVDASPEMVRAALSRLEREAPAIRARIVPTVGDMTALQVADRSVELITAGYGVRNVPDYARAVAEMARVARPGATLVTLDFYRPQNVLWRRLLLGYLAAAGNAVGWLWHRDPVVYGYIARSIDRFVSWQTFSRMLQANGFTVQRVIRHLGGGIAVHVATRDA